MSRANHWGKAARAVSRRLYARDRKQEFKPDSGLQTRWHTFEVNLLLLHLGTVS